MEKRFFTLAELRNTKGLEFVVKALRLLPEFRLEIVGQGSYKREIIRLAKKLEVLERISFSQDLSREELLKKYSEASVLVLLSKFEAYGLVVAEALASKTPCVAKTSALAEWVDEKNVFGISYPPSIPELAELIKKALKLKWRG
jgi:glycosyltransferase involved in cell wall biosynthesis